MFFGGTHNLAALFGTIFMGHFEWEEIAFLKLMIYGLFSFRGSYAWNLLLAEENMLLMEFV